MTPTRKVTAAAAGGSLATLILLIAGLAGFELPMGAEGAIATFAAFVIAYATGEHDDPGQHAADE